MALRSLSIAISNRDHAQAAETTPLNPDDEQQFQHWAASNQLQGIDVPDSHYDMRGYWKAHPDATPVPGDHFPDTFKQHGHPTFSSESQYSRGPQDGGAWLGDQLLAPPVASHETPISVTDTATGAQKLLPSQTATVTDTASGDARPVLLPSHTLGGAENPTPTFGLDQSLRRRSSPDTVPTPSPTHLPNEQNGFVRAKSPIEMSDDRMRARTTMPWNQTDYTEPMATLPGMGGMRVPEHAVSWLDPTSVMTSEYGGQPIKGFVSRIERDLLPQIKNATHPNRILGMLKAGVAAPEEAEYRGLTAWLKSKGDTKVTPQDLHAFLAGHPLDVRETHYGGPMPKLKDMDGGNWMAKWNRPDLNLPGGENYREIVLHAPPREDAFPSYEEWLKAEVNPEFHGPRDSMDNRRTYAESREHFAKKNTTYTSHAFPEKNILAWLRMDDRRLPSGEPIAFIQEGQSDWHQAGREKGYQRVATEKEKQAALMSAGNAKIAETSARRRLENALLEAGLKIQHGPDTRSEARAFSYWATVTPSSSREWTHPSMEWSSKSSADTIAKIRNVAQEYQSKYDALTIAMRDAEKVSGAAGVPDAPFKGTGWQELAFNRAVIDAVDRGKQGIAWTTGAQQAERYGKLLQGVKRIEWNKTAKELTVWDRGMSSHEFNAGTEDGVAAVIGKSATKQLIDEANLVRNDHAYTLDTAHAPLTIGSAGMNQQYDTNWVNYANKMGKPFGAAVKNVPMAVRPQAEFKIVAQGDAGQYAVYEITHNADTGIDGLRWRDSFDTHREADRYAASLEKPAQTGETIHYLPFTPEFIDHVKGGIPIRETPASFTSAIAQRESFVQRLGTPDGGFTVHAVTGAEPTSGFGVGVAPDRGVVIPPDASELDILRALQQFKADNADALSKPNIYFGGWKDPKDGKIYLDVSQIAQSSGEARALALQHDQKAYFDFRQGKSIDIGAGQPQGPRPASMQPTTAPPAQMSPEGWAKFKEGFVSTAHNGLAALHNTLMNLSFGDGTIPATETMSAVASDSGRTRGTILHGGASELLIPTEAKAAWVKAGKPLVLAHTHPASSAFSFDDLIAHMSMQQGEGVKVHSMVVFGRDGSWYDMRWKAPASEDELDRVYVEHASRRRAAEKTATNRTTAWAAKQYDFTPVGEDLFRDNKTGKHMIAQEFFFRTPEMQAEFDKNYRDESAKVWEALAPLFGGTYRYHLAPR